MIFPCGQDGWSLKCKHTCLQHANFQFMDRNDDNGDRVVNPTICAKTLSQQYLVDQFCKIELQRLNYLKDNQDTLRAEVYRGYQDATKAADQDIKNIAFNIC